MADISRFTSMYKFKIEGLDQVQIIGVIRYSDDIEEVIFEFEEIPKKRIRSLDSNSPETKRRIATSFDSIYAVYGVNNQFTTDRNVIKYTLTKILEHFKDSSNPKPTIPKEQHVLSIIENHIDTQQHKALFCSNHNMELDKIKHQEIEKELKIVLKKLKEIFEEK